MRRDRQEKRSLALRCPHPRAATVLDKLPPALAGDVAFRIFCTPELSQHRSPDHEDLTARARFHLRNAKWQRVPTPSGEVQSYIFEPDGAPRGTVLLVHGWTSEASFMTAFTEPLRRSGLRVIAFDFPAHGLSEGRRTNLADCARSMLAVCDYFGPIDAVVAHSFGGFVSLLVAEGGPPMEHSAVDRPLRAHLVPEQAVGGGAQLRPQPEARVLRHSAPTSAIWNASAIAPWRRSPPRS